MTDEPKPSVEILSSTEWTDTFQCLLCYEQFTVSIDSDSQRHPTKGHQCKHGWAGDLSTVGGKGKP